MAGKIAILLCEHYRREAEAVLALGGFEDAIVAAFPARCNRPPLLPEELETALFPLGDLDRVDIFSAASCLCNIKDSPEELPHCRVHRLPQCFSMVADQEIINRSILDGAYLVTPGCLAEWPACLERMGLNRETARTMFHETTSRVILLDTGVDAMSGSHLKDFADFIDRPCQIVPVGLLFLRLQLTQIILTWRLEIEKRESSEATYGMRKQSADYAMAVDLLSQMARTTEETEAVEAMLDVFTMLFAAGRVSFLSFVDGRPDKLYLRPQTMDSLDSETIRIRLAGLREESVLTESGTGFLLRIVHRGETQGVVAVEEIAFPEYREHYLNLALSIANVCALPIDNARKYEKLRLTEAQLREANDALLRLATTDALTGIANRRAFDEYLEREWKRMLREKMPLSLIMCDIDYFKKYNDLYGHQAGDSCLYDVAQALHNCMLRPGDFVARYGGEEFVVILPGTPVEGALHIAEQIRSAVRKLTISHAGSEVDSFVTLSLGVAHGVPSSETNANDVLQTADTALYKAKKQGRNRVVVADTKMH
ncbi:MAG: diguanylate cyclase [Desulfobacterales bacterium]